MTAHLLLAVALGVYADVGFHAPAAWAIGPLLGTPWLVLSFSAARASGTALLAVGAVVGAGCGLLGAMSLSRAQALRAVAWATVVAAPIVDIWVQVPSNGGRVPVSLVLAAVAAALFGWAMRTGEVSTRLLMVGTAVAALALGQAQVLVLRHLFGFNI